jgi:hypothetical protein
MHPSHMTDTELDSLLTLIKRSTKVENFNPEQNQILVEHLKRQKFIQSCK